MADESQAQDLMIYRIEEAVKERVSKWASRQLAIIAALGNLIILFGVGTVGYNFMKTTLETVVKDGVDQRIIAERGKIDAAVNSYRSLVDNALAELNEKRREIEELKVRLKEATADAEKTAKTVALLSDESQRDYAAFKERIAETDLQMRNASRVIAEKYEALQANYKKWGKDIYARASIAIDILGRNLAELRAMRIIADDELYSLKYRTALSLERQDIDTNSKTLIILYIQSGMDRKFVDELKWELGLRLRGFLVVVVYSGSSDYDKSRSFLQQDTPGLEDITYINDQCTIVPPAGGADYFRQVQEELEGIGMPTECIKQQSWRIGKDILPSVDDSILKRSEKVVISYFLKK